MYRLLALVVLLALLAGLFFWWHEINQFNALEYRWWDWLLRYFKATKSIPPEFKLPAFVMVPCIVLFPTAIAAIGARAGSETLNGGRKSEELHGSAHWATKKDLKTASLLEKEGAVVGGLKKPLGKADPLRHNGPEHILCFAPTRSGKGVGLVLPTLLSWTDSCLVLDIKGENYALTSGWRKTIGQKVFKFAPAQESGATRFNPLAEVRIGTGHVIADCQNVGIMMVDPDGKGLKDHWMKDGWDWLTGAILHVVHQIQIEEKRAANLMDVMMFMSAAVDDEETDEDAANEGFNQLLNDMMTNDHQDFHVNKAVRKVCGRMKIKAFSEKSGVHSTASEPLNLYIDPIVAGNVEKSDFQLKELMNGDMPASLYIVIPPKDIGRLKPLIRIVMNMFLNFQMEDMEFKDGASVKGYKHRLLLMLDEFTSIGKLEIFQKSLAYMAGYGLKAFIIVQDMAQLQSEKEGYGRDEAITSNCHIRIAYAPNKIETAEYLSKLTGKATVIQKKQSKSAKHTSLMGGNMSESISETSRPLLTPDECMRLKGPVKNSEGKILKAGDMLTFAAGFPPYLGRQCLYFKDKSLLSRAAIPMPRPVRKD
jgi:type IV secretion system protein VirD4